MVKSYYFSKREELKKLFNEGRYDEMSNNEAFQHDVKWMLENGGDFFISNSEILKSLTINDCERLPRHLRKIDAELESTRLSSNYWDYTIEGFVITYTESLDEGKLFYACPIIVIDADEVFFDDHNLNECGRYYGAFYASQEVWDDVITTDNWDQLMDVYADPENYCLYPAEQLLGISYYGDLGRIFYRCDEIALEEEETYERI